MKAAFAKGEYFSQTRRCNLAAVTNTLRSNFAPRIAAVRSGWLSTVADRRAAGVCHLSDGRAQFRYSLHGPIQAHPSRA